MSRRELRNMPSSQIVGDNMRCRRKRRSPEENEQFLNAKEKQKVCLLCLGDEDNEIEFGKFYEKEDLTVHYFCLLLGSGLCQNTRVNDKKSILGFVLNDIRKEIKRGSKLRCCFCHKNGASIGCCIKTCKKTFHLCCGRKNGTMHQFYDNYRSYCPDHIPVQLVKKASNGMQSPSRSCAICLTRVTQSSASSLVSPCCMRSCFHRICLQKYAISAGLHYFKCPLCNAVKEFQKEMLEFGIYIPDQDASWEREPNAYMDLLERHDTCDAPKCKCPKGNKHDADTGMFELLLCGWCGSFGSHRACGGLVYKEGTMMCYHCSEITDTVINVKKNKDDTSKSKGEFHCPHSTSLPAQNRRGGRLRRQLFNDSVLETAGSSYSQAVSRFRQVNNSIVNTSDTVNKNGREDPLKVVPSIYLNGKLMTSDETNKFNCLVRLERLDTEICMRTGEVDLKKISINLYSKFFGKPYKMYVPDNMPSLVFMGEDFGVMDSSLEGPPMLSPQMSDQVSSVQTPKGTLELPDFNFKSSSSEDVAQFLGKLYEKQCVDNLTEVQQNCLHSFLRSPSRACVKIVIPPQNSLNIFQENKNPKSFKKAINPLLSEQKSIPKNRPERSKIRKRRCTSQNVNDLKQTTILDFFN